MLNFAHICTFFHWLALDWILSVHHHSDRDEDQGEDEDENEDDDNVKDDEDDDNVDVVLKTYIGFRDQIFPFSENWPANYNFSLFSKLPTNYPKISEKI